MAADCGQNTLCERVWQPFIYSFFFKNIQQTTIKFSYPSLAATLVARYQITWRRAKDAQCVFRPLIKFDVVDPASFIVMPTLPLAIPLLGPTVKLLSLAKRHSSCRFAYHNTTTAYSYLWPNVPDVAHKGDNDIQLVGNVLPSRRGSSTASSETS